MQIKPEAFERQTTPEKEIYDEGMQFHLTEKITYDDGIKTYFVGSDIPQKGNAPAECIVAINFAKKIALNAVLTLSKGYFWSSLVFLALSNKKKLLDFVVRRYNDMTYRTMKPYILKPEMMTEFARELMIFVTNFALYFKIEQEQAEYFGKTIGHIFEYDNAYRYRAQDLFTTTTKEQLIKYPASTIQEMAITGLNRCGGKENRVGKNTYLLGMLLSGLFLLPSFRNAFKYAMSGVEYKNLCFDEIDTYWVSMRTDDYLFFGEETDVRSKRNEGKAIPVAISREALDDINQANFLLTKAWQAKYLSKEKVEELNQAKLEATQLWQKKWLPQLHQ